MGAISRAIEKIDDKWFGGDTSGSIATRAPESRGVGAYGEEGSTTVLEDDETGKASKLKKKLVTKALSIPIGSNATTGTLGSI